MGVWTEYDILIKNPAVIHDIDENYSQKWKNMYQWQHKVRVILPDGKVTQPGKYDNYGNIVVNNQKYFISNLDIFDDKPKDGLMIHDITYQYLQKNPLYKKCLQDHNLFKMIQKYSKYKDKIKAGPPEDYEGEQDLWISQDNEDPDPFNIELKDKWAFENPENKTEEAKKNKLRILAIINDFLEFNCLPKKLGTKTESKKALTSKKSLKLNKKKIAKYLLGTSTLGLAAYTAKKYLSK